MKYSLLVQTVLLGATAAAPLSGNYVVKETHNVPATFTRLGDAPAHHSITLSVGLKQSQFEELERQLLEVSDPDHPRYGQHLSQEEVNELIKPTEESLALVQEWLHQHVDPAKIEYTPAKDFLKFTLPLSAIERLLDTKYSTYEHDDGFRLVRTPQWSLPFHLHEHIETIQPTNSFLRPIAQAKTLLTVPGTLGTNLAPLQLAEGEIPTVASACNIGSITPGCLRALYGTAGYKPQAGSKNQVALNDFLGELNNRSDTRLYLEKFRPAAVAGADEFKQVSVNGGTVQQKPETKKQLNAGTGIEGALDVETILGMAYPVPLTCYSTGGSPPFIPDFSESTDENEPYLTWLQYILKQKFIPQTISNSYEDDEQTVPPSYARSVCSHFAQLGARGVTVLFGSGDGGVAGVQPGGACISNVDGKERFIPLFPSSCPYVTSVGATVNFSPEVVAYDPRNGFVSGGGFSNYFKQPSYQSEAVAGYLKYFGNQYAKYYNKSGRAYPDIAAYGVNFTIAWDAQFFNVDGTSASTPTAASVLTFVNDALIAAGKPPLGFMNPWLYKKGYAGFTDVTKGNTMGCNTTGFTATKGWDAASGFGTPIFSKLVKLAMAA